jgi:hypothetical protein
MRVFVARSRHDTTKPIFFPQVFTRNSQWLVTT